ncbi:hypothetical protein WDZ92_45265 [Nostoc sp. NIES-2111]
MKSDICMRSRYNTEAFAQILGLCLLGTLVTSGPLAAQTVGTQPHPFPPQTSVYKWHYTCPTLQPTGTCRFYLEAANYAANNVSHARVVLAYQPVGAQQMPFYYFSITVMGKDQPDLVMLQSNAGVSFVAQGMTLGNETGPILSETDSHVN